VPLERRHVEDKIAAVHCYTSQEERTYTSRKAIESLAIARGTQIQKPFAEAFEVVRLIM